MQTFIFHTCQAASALNALFLQYPPTPDPLPEQLVEEWNEFFGVSMFDSMFSLFLSIAGKCPDGSTGQEGREKKEDKR